MQGTLSQEQVLQLLSAYSRHGQLYPPFANVNEETGFGQKHPFDYFQSTDADAWQEYSGVAHIGLLLAKNLGIVTEDWNYMPRGMPLSYGIDALTARRERMAGRAEMRQKVVGDRAVELAIAIARQRGEVLTRQRMDEIKDGARQFDLLSAAFESVAPKWFETAMGPTGSGMALYDEGYRLASYRTHYDGTRYQAPDSVRYARQFMDALHDKKSTITSQEAAAFHSHLSAHGLFRHTEDRDIRISEVPIPQLYEEAQKFLFTPEARTSSNTAIRQASQKAHLFQEIHNTHRDMRDLYEASQNPARTEEQRKRDRARLAAMSNNFRELVNEALERGDKGEIILSDADRKTLMSASPIDMSPSPDALATLRALLQSEKPLARIKREFALTQPGNYEWLFSGITDTNREQIRDSLKQAEAAGKEIDSLHQIKRDLADSENFGRFREVERHFDTIQQKTGGKVDILNRTTAIVETLQSARQGGDTAPKDMEDRLRSLLGGADADAADIRTLLSLTTGPERLSDNEQMAVASMARRAATRALDTQIGLAHEKKFSALDVLRAGADVHDPAMEESFLKNLEVVEESQKLLEEMTSNTAFRSFVRNSVGLARTKEDLAEYRKGLEVLKEVITSPEMSPDQLARLFTSFAGGAMFATNAADLKKHIAQAYGMGSQLGYGDEEIQARFSHSRQMTDMVGVNRAFVPWHATESMAYDLANHRMEPSAKLQGYWGAQNLNEVGMKQSQIFMGFAGSEAGNILGAALRIKEFMEEGGRDISDSNLHRWMESKLSGQGTFTTITGEVMSTRISEDYFRQLAYETNLPGSINLSSVLGDISQNQRAIYEHKDKIAETAMGDQRAAIVSRSVSDLMTIAKLPATLNKQARQEIEETIQTELMSAFDSKSRERFLQSLPQEQRERIKKDPSRLLTAMVHAALKEKGYGKEVTEQLHSSEFSHLLNAHSRGILNMDFVAAFQTLDPQNVVKAKEQRVLSDSYEREINFSTLMRVNSTTRDTLKSFAEAGFNLADVVAGLSGATALTEEQKSVFKEHQEKSAAITRAEISFLQSEEMGDEDSIARSRDAVREAKHSYEKFLDTAGESLREIGKIIDQHEAELQERLQSLDTSDPQRIRNEQRIAEARQEFLDYAEENKSLLLAKNLPPEIIEQRAEELSRRKGAYEDAVEVERKRAEAKQAQALDEPAAHTDMGRLIPQVAEQSINKTVQGLPVQSQPVILRQAPEQVMPVCEPQNQPPFKPLEMTAVKEASSFIAIRPDTPGIYGIDFSSPHPFGISALSQLGRQQNDLLMPYKPIEPVNWMTRGTEGLSPELLKTGTNTMSGAGTEAEVSFPELKTLQLHVDKLEIGGVPIWRPDVPDATISGALATQHAGFGHP